jgi:dipeptidyl aminopeptidase/acylaminoacyl peptidase
MKRLLFRTMMAALLIALAIPLSAAAQGTLADYERARGLRERFQALALNVVDRAAWVEKTGRFWYRRTVKGGAEFMLVDTDKLEKRPAFDHARLAASLSAASGEKFEPFKLPFFAPRFVDEGKAVEFEAAGSRWKCELEAYVCSRLGPVEPEVWPPPWNSQYIAKEPSVSPDGKREAFVKDSNIFLRAKVSGDEKRLTTDGSEGDFYAGSSLRWAPDSKKLAATRVRPGFHRVLHYVESSPADQIQPKSSTVDYVKPGDALAVERPVILDVEAGTEIRIDDTLFPNEFEMSEIVWRKDSRSLTFEYNQRGHQVYRVLEADAATGNVRALIDERAKTFFAYSGKKYRHDVADGREIIWMSERDGWNHLYLYDGASGAVKNQITKGHWVVRGVERVDEEARRIWFRAGGVFPGEDPYFVHLCAVNFDGTGLAVLTAKNANHSVQISDDGKCFVDTSSRVDTPPVCEVRRTADGGLVMGVEKADIRGLLAAGWRAPEAFVAKGRDGATDIWGVIVRPMNFRKSKKYPVIENIYAGPHDSFVPKSFAAWNPMMSLAELGFIVVQIDGMGTSNRSKAFHDVCWKNLADAGFPDRILWHKAVAARDSSYDARRVGIYGTSAGGQSAMGALLFHPEFYKAAVASCGCHDNRMDKIWWNEQWMGWPVGPEYAASSNVDNAWRLRGRLLLYVGEMDTNVDPSSTMQVVNALLKAGKAFDLLVIPGANHTSGGVFGERQRYDFFVRHLLGVEPPDWNVLEPGAAGFKTDPGPGRNRRSQPAAPGPGSPNPG